MVIVSFKRLSPLERNIAVYEEFEYAKSNTQENFRMAGYECVEDTDRHERWTDKYYDTVEVFYTVTGGGTAFSLRDLGLE